MLWKGIRANVPRAHTWEQVWHFSALFLLNSPGFGVSEFLDFWCVAYVRDGMEKKRESEWNVHNELVFENDGPEYFSSFFRPFLFFYHLGFLSRFLFRPFHTFLIWIDISHVQITFRRRPHPSPLHLDQDWEDPEDAYACSCGNVVLREPNGASRRVWACGTR